MPFSRSKHNRSKPPVLWPDLRYGPNGEVKLFNSPEEVPVGWIRKIGEPELERPVVKTLDRQQVIEDLAEHDIVADPTWSVVRLKELLDTFK